MGMFKNFVFSFSDKNICEQEKLKLEKLGYSVKFFTTDFPTYKPYRLSILTKNNENLVQIENENICVVLEIDGEDKIFKKENCRGISILLEDATRNDIVKIQDFCNQNVLHYKYRYSKDKSLTFKSDVDDNVNKMDEKTFVPLFYFWICSDTMGFEKLNAFMGGRLILTDYAEFGNIADKDETFMENLISVLDCCKKLRSKETKINDELCKFIKTIDDAKTLVSFLSMYGCHLTDFQKKLVQNRIDVLNNERFHFEEEMLESIKSMDCDVAKLRALTGMNRKEFANHFQIPYRTIEDWENKKSNCSSYLYKLLLYYINNEFVQ